MYFKEKEDTNIDKEFEGSKKSNFNFDFNKILKNPKFLLIGGGILIAIIVVVAVISLLGNSNNYRLELEGTEKITVILGDDYIEPGYKAYDKNGNDCTNQVEITSTIDTNTIGEYEILYSIDKINKIRYVSVIEPETIIYLTGGKNMCLELGKKYNEPGYSATDSKDGDLTKKVKVTGSVNHQKEGIYKRTYSVVNSRNQTITVTRNIRVAKSC